MEWCKQLIAATISSQISGSVPSEGVPRDYRVSDFEECIDLFSDKRVEDREGPCYVD